jgi:CMP-N-acetylneuraminic acid synthetase
MYEVPKWKSLEIDDSLDLILVKTIIQNKQKNIIFFKTT